MWKQYCEHCNQEVKTYVDRKTCDNCGKSLDGVPSGVAVPIGLLPDHLGGKITSGELDNGMLCLNVSTVWSGIQLQYCMDCLINLLLDARSIAEQEKASCADNATG